MPPDKAPSDEAVEKRWTIHWFDPTIEVTEAFCSLEGPPVDEEITVVPEALLEEEREARRELEAQLEKEHGPWVQEVLAQTEPALRALERKVEAAVARAEKAEKELAQLREESTRSDVTLEADRRRGTGSRAVVLPSLASRASKIGQGNEDNQRAELDWCNLQPDCPAVLHLSDCPKHSNTS